MAQINQNMTHGSLFSGIGGFDLAAEWMGWDNIFHCEWNPFGQKVLKHHFPNSISYNDITKTDFSIHAGKIDILTGGFPCQPYSSAGKRLGKADERHLFPEMLRCIKEVKPRYIVGENVRGLVSWGGDWYSMRCAMIWKGKAMQYNRFLFLLQVSAHRTKDKGYGLLPTPMASEGDKMTGSITENQMSLTKMARQGMLPTPDAQDWNSGTKPETYEARKQKHKLKGVNLHMSLRQMAMVVGKTSQLSPLFVEEMMGFPVNWTLSPFLNGEKNQSKPMETQ
jgi:hypothetical protein